MPDKATAHRAWGACACLVCVLAVLAVPTRASAIQRAAESVNSGGAGATSASYRAHDSIAQHAIGPLGEGASLRIHDGFWLGLPGINVPVEGIVYAVLADDGRVVLRWTVGSLADVTGFNVYRATDENGPYARVNSEPLPPSSPGSFEDATVWPETTFWYEVRAVLGDGAEEVVTGSPASVTIAGMLAMRLYPPRPNPSAGPMTVRFDVPDQSAHVRVDVYNVRGQRVTTLLDETLGRGRHERAWSGWDDAGRPVAVGVYFVRLEVNGRTDDEKVLVLR